MKRSGPFPTQQQRSVDTLNRILAAAESLLEEKDFSQISMHDIARRAKRAVGTVYARVPGKDDLLAHLFERVAERFERDTQDLLARGRANAWSLERRTRETALWITNAYSSHPGLIRALAHCIYYEEQSVTVDFRAQWTRQSQEVAAFIAGDGRGITHRNPREAAEFGLLTILAMAQNRIVFGRRSGIQAQIPHRTLARELGRVLYGYLTTKPGELR